MVASPAAGRGFAPLGRGGERLRPTFLFLSREKKKRADLRAKCLASLGCAPKRACGRRPGTKKKSAGSGFRDESCSFFVCVYVLTVGVLVLCGLVSPFAPLTLTGAGGQAYALEPVAFVAKAALFHSCSMS